MFATMKDLGGHESLLATLLIISFLPQVELADSVGGEDSESADRDEDQTCPESLAPRGEAEMDIVTETHHHLTLSYPGLALIMP